MNLPTLSRTHRLGLAGAALIAVGAAGGAGAVSLTRPPVEMAPTVVTPAAKLASSNGIVTVRGRVAEVYGDRLIVQDPSGRAMVDAGRNGGRMAQVGAPLLVQGRYDNGQLRAHFLVDAAGQVAEVGPPPHGRRGPGGPEVPGGPRGPRGGPGGPPPPPPGAGAPPPPPPPGGPDGAGMGQVPPPPPPPGMAAQQPAAGTVPPAPPPPPANGQPPARR